jgi:non-canonical (house-cleaning) NTP pyrophosphatase
MTIAIASKRGPKVEAARAVSDKLKHFFTSNSSPIEYLTFEIDGGVEMPRTLDELLRGARQRVAKLLEATQSQQRKADFFVGMEGGFHTVHHDGRNLTFLQSWAFVSDGTAGHFGSSGNILVPERIAKEVMTHGRDLSVVIDETAQQKDVRSKQGTWGILTRDLLTRQQSFEIALTAAFAPFYNKKVYEEGQTG